ncbi:hypothetical protein PLICRDRAFT_42268 [Plicaturopsis crispa FD-325 SS-3]|nr:hypothetical protein PLICRDRAFT_42268 [Plicaturopsis crispa FD-325 SS-3]
MSTQVQTDPTKRETNPDGSFKANVSTFRNFLEKGGQFEPERGRYHLYVSYTCPYATRTLIARKLKGLEDIIPITVLSPKVGKNGFPFANADEDSPFPGAEDDPLYGSKYLRDLYLKANPDYSGRPTIPVLWDKETHTIVNNDSAEIVRIFNSAFNDAVAPEAAELDLYPSTYRAEIDELSAWMYEKLNAGVYKTGFASTQELYSQAVAEVFSALDTLEERLRGKPEASQGRKYLVGDSLTEADIKLWVTLIRFDPAYVGQFKCNIRTIRDGYPALNSWMKALYWTVPAFKESTDFEHIKTGYYWSSVSNNPHRIVPVGPLPPIEPL